MTDTSTDHIRIAACVLALLTFALEASAQSPAAFVGGGIVLSQWHLEPPHQGSPSLRYFTSTPDSLLTGFSADVGVFLSPHFAIGGEFSRPFQRTDITSTNNYMLRVTEIHSRYCESSLFATVRGVWPVGSSGRAGVLGGAGLLVGNSLQRRRISPSLFEAEQQVTESFFGIMFGGEFAIALNRRVSIVPDARFYVVDRGEVTKPGYYLELPTTLFQSHVGVRVGL